MSGSRSNILSRAEPWLPLAVWVGLFAYLGDPEHLIQLAGPGEAAVMIWTAPLKHLAGFAAILAVALRGALARRGHWSLPLYGLPASWLGLLARPWVSPELAANLWWYGTAGFGGWTLARAWAHWPDTPLVLTPRRRIALLLVFTLLFTATGIYFTRAIGYHSGDEGHYVTQAYSLIEDGDLDIRNNVPDPDPSRTLQYHISANSRDGKWYSWHPFGLSILIAPLLVFGMEPAHVVVALFSALALLGLFEACRLWGVSARTAWTLNLLWASSLLWGAYSSRFLPEIPGAALCIWAMIAIVIRPTHPRASLILLLVCTGLMPWMQTRFLPLSLMMIGLYGLDDLLEAAARKSWAPFRHAVLTGIGAVAAYALYVWIHHRMYINASPYPSGALLMSMPSGLWHVLTSERSPLYSTAMFAALLPGAILALRLPGERRRRTLQALAAFAAVWLTSCSNHWYVGGAAVPGRYLVAISVLLVAPSAQWIDRRDAAARTWVFGLGLLSALVWMLVLIYLPDFKKSFAMPVGSAPLVADWLTGLNNFLLSPYHTSRHLFGLALYVVGLAFLGARSPRLRIAAIAGLLATGAFSRGAPAAPEGNLTHNARGLGRLLPGAGWMITPSGMPGFEPPRPLFEYADRFDDVPDARWLKITTLPREKADRGMIAQPGLPVNDWKGRTLAWATLIGPFEEVPGPKVLRVAGRTRGSVTPILAVRKGSRDAVLEEPIALDAEGRFDITRSFTLEGGGDIYLLMRLDGKGDVVIGDMQWSAWSDRVGERLNLVRPGD